MIGVVEEGPEAAEAYFNQWVDEVKATVPKERLLVFEPKEGWKPLCNFLGLPEPGRITSLLTQCEIHFHIFTDIPFPRLNDTSEMRRNARIGKVVSYVVVVGAPILLGIGLVAGLLTALL